MYTQPECPGLAALDATGKGSVHPLGTLEVKGEMIPAVGDTRPRMTEVFAEPAQLT